MTLNRAVPQSLSVDTSQDNNDGLLQARASSRSAHPVTRGGHKLICTILRLPAVKAETGYSRSTIYLRISQGLWPRPVSLGPRSVGWPANEVAAINSARIAGKADDEIRSLVARLHAARKKCLQ
jgi:prophage regulatory protein